MQTHFDTLHAASRQQITLDWPLRRDRLQRLPRLIKENTDAIAAAINADFGRRPAEETRLLEIFPSLQGIDYALRHGKRWMRTQRQPTNLWFQPGQSSIMPQPLGVIGIIAPWNYPLYLTIGPLTGALAAGNRVMIKPSEYTPQFAALLAELISKYFDADEIAVILGDADTARAFSTLPFDHLLVTGSTSVGHQVMRSAADQLTPVTLELGGKSPAIIGPKTIIGPEGDFERAVERILYGKLINAGQTCIAPDYVLLPSYLLQPFIDTARHITNRLYPGLRDYTAIINPNHYQRLQGLLTDAKIQGAQLHPLSDQPTDNEQRILPPVLLSQTSDNMQIMQREIFGPQLPLVTYRTLDEAIAYINARPRPLALYLFERNRAVIDQVLSQTVSGGVCLNDTLLHIAQDSLPFGGVGASGMGAYHGYQGFVTFSKLKPVFRQSRLNGAALLQPPYGKVFRVMMRLLLR